MFRVAARQPPHTQPTYRRCARTPTGDLMLSTHAKSYRIAAAAVGCLCHCPCCCFSGYPYAVHVLYAHAFTFTPNAIRFEIILAVYASDFFVVVFFNEQTHERNTIVARPVCGGTCAWPTNVEHKRRSVIVIQNNGVYFARELMRGLCFPTVRFFLVSFACISCTNIFFQLFFFHS